MNQNQNHNETQTMREMARIGAAMNDDGEAFTRTLRAFGATPTFGGPAADEAREFVAAQVYALVDEQDEQTAPEQARAFVDGFAAVFDIESMADINALLGREKHIQANYEGQLAFAAAE